MSKEKLNLTTVKQNLLLKLDEFKKYNFLLFLALVLVLYGVVIFRIQMLRNAQPSSESIAQQVKEAKVPHINEAVVQKLESLHDNSVNVQSLFDGARSNPFKE